MGTGHEVSGHETSKIVPYRSSGFESCRLTSFLGFCSQFTDQSRSSRKSSVWNSSEKPLVTLYNFARY